MTDLAAAYGSSGKHDSPGLSTLLLIATVAALLILALSLNGWPGSLPDLAKGDNMTTAGVYTQWDIGNVVVLVRHAETCSHSTHPCLGPSDGITRIGSETAIETGKALTTLGLTKTDLLTSPLQRTAQTAYAMFGKAIPQRDWLMYCDHSMLQDVITHKAPHRNLVLITHGDCIDRMEKALGYPHAGTSEYASSLFINLGHTGKPEAMGYLNAADWQSTLDKKP
ncbi:histidine phosphatase family protein [Pseudomonas sp. NA-150]|uniref:lipopolysaccharide core heptose(II)-phosphate phosphatase PmrG n=1 Tax=Pseudomonas sp. NA-150 TaxID=3367525 RepID=UPI0037C6A99E